MKYIDLRKLSSGELKQVRRQVVRLKEMGKTGKEIEELTGVRQNRASEIWTAYQRQGEAALEVNKGGRPEGSGRILHPEEEAKIRETIVNRQPKEFGLPGCLWTLKKVCEYVKKTYRKKMTDRCASDYMRRWGLSCQRPVKRARKQEAERVQKWKSEEYPAIAQRAQEENAEIYWGDETGISNCENYERGFPPKGQPPVLSVETNKERVNMISALTSQGKVRYMLYEGSMNQQRLITFLRNLIQTSKQKVFLILDNLKVHHGKIVAEWVSRHRDKIEIFFLPPYTPESNPDEYLNHALKLSVHSGDLPENCSDIRHKTNSFMRILQRNKDKVLAFFRHPLISYAFLQR